MELSKPFNFEDNLFTDHPSHEDPALQLPILANIEVERESIPGLLEQSSCDNTQRKFFQEYKKIYSVSYHLHNQKIKLMSQLQKLEKRISVLRCHQTPDKKYKCEIDQCSRLYCTKDSLHQHIKLKHPQHKNLLKCQEENEELIDSS